MGLQRQNKRHGAYQECTDTREEYGQNGSGSKITLVQSEKKVKAEVRSK